MRRAPRVLPALVTPFDRRGEIDLDAHRHNLAVLGAQGVAGFLIAGSTGEGPLLEPGEREALTAAARRAVPRAFLLGGIAAESSRNALRQAEEHAAGGADAVLALTPTTVVRGRHELVAGFFADLADRSALPVLLYGFPRLTGYELPVDVVAELAGHPNVAGMKDSGGDPVRAAAIVGAVPEHFLLFTGSSAAISLAVGAGAFGAITASANHLPTLVAEVVRRARRSPANAAGAQRRLTTAAAGIERFGIPGTKAAAALAGLRPGSVRSPLRPLRRGEASAVKAAWAAARDAG
jgi:dihydrodipicolinate synthase/N-acetylneuraminate lyase